MPDEQPLPDGWRLVEVSDIDSTNAELLRRAELGEPEGLALRSDAQTSGRGRRGRTWASPSGNLYLSILIDAPLGRAGQVGFAVAVSLIEVIEQEIGRRLPELECKWPNDLLYRGSKVGGLLLEGASEQNQVVAGMGVNLVKTGVQDAIYPTASLEDFSLKAEALAPKVCVILERWLNTWRTLGFEPLRHAWLDRASGIGQSIIVRLPRDTYEGTFMGLAEDGALLLDQGAAGLKSVSAGDVFFRAEV